MPKTLSYSIPPVFLITAIMWGVGIANHTFLMHEFWLYVGIFLIPSGAVCGSIWLIGKTVIWQRIVGLILILPCTALWALSLLLVSNGFRIH